MRILLQLIIIDSKLRIDLSTCVLFVNECDSHGRPFWLEKNFSHELCVDVGTGRAHECLLY